MGFGSRMAGAAARGAIRGALPRGYPGSMYPRRRRGPSSIIALIIIAALSGVYHKYQSNKPLPQDPLQGRAQWVFDGDTFKLNGQSIRLWGIDAPERETKHGPLATNALSRLLKGNTVVCTAVDRSYERIVARCVAKGIDLSQLMVKAGWARDLPNKSSGRYRADETEAKKLKRGMWKA